MVTAIVKPARLEAVRKALIDVGVQGLTASEVSGFGRQKGHTEIYRGAEYEINFVPKSKVEVAVGDDQVDGVNEALRTAAHPSRSGDRQTFGCQNHQANLEMLCHTHHLIATTEQRAAGLIGVAR